MIAKVDRNTCIGCGACTAVCPEVFELDDEGLSRAYVNPVPADVESDALEAERGCPVEAISIEK